MRTAPMASAEPRDHRDHSDYRDRDAQGEHSGRSDHSDHSDRSDRSDHSDHSDLNDSAAIHDPAEVVVARMAHQPLHAHALLRHAARVHADAAVTSVLPQGGSVTLGYAALAERAWSRAAELLAHGLRAGDRVIHLGFSSADQLAWVYGALSIGVVTHLLNPQHAAGDVLRLARAAQPRLLLHDAPAAAQAHALARQLGGVPVLMLDHMAAAAPKQPSTLAAPVNVREDAPALVCYSSGTTGLPKAVESTHRSTVLHAWACALPDAMGLTAQDRVMPLMQACHATAWGAPFVCPLVGAALVLVPPSRDPALWYQWIEEHRVTVLGAVSAHWLALAQHMRAHGLRFTTLRRTVVGGARLPPDVARGIAEGLGVEVCHAWGMTETSPLATIERWDGSGVLRHGKPVFGIELAVRDADAQAGAGHLPHGTGELLVRGHWVAQRDTMAAPWLTTGDLAHLDANGRLEVIDRLGDAVTGPAGHLSSALVEHQARCVPGVVDAALLAPLAAGQGSTLAWVGRSGDALDAVTAQLADRLATAFGGWVPGRIVAVEALPYTSTAKVCKGLLRARLARCDMGR